MGKYKKDIPLEYTLYICSKENSETFTWYEYCIGQGTNSQKGDFKPEIGKKLRGLTLQEDL